MAQTITLTQEDRKYLQSLVRQRTLQVQVVDRAKMNRAILMPQ